MGCALTPHVRKSCACSCSVTRPLAPQSRLDPSAEVYPQSSMDVPAGAWISVVGCRVAGWCPDGVLAEIAWCRGGVHGEFAKPIWCPWCLKVGRKGSTAQSHPHLLHGMRNLHPLRHKPSSAFDLVFDSYNQVPNGSLRLFTERTKAAKMAAQAPSSHHPKHQPPRQSVLSASLSTHRVSRP